MNDQREFWKQVLTVLRAGDHCALLCVVESMGSSPGRAGFKMCVTSSGAIFGSIGGGSMEHKLVELARSLMSSPVGSPADDPTGTSQAFPFLKRQVHQAGIGKDRSGMICSGEQTVAFYHAHPVHMRALADAMARIEIGVRLDLVLNSSGFQFVPAGDPSNETATTWSYTEPANVQPRISIIGAGHVSLALSRTMEQLGFRVHVFDDRTGLSTLQANAFAHERTIIDYANMAEHLAEDAELYVVLASFGYRTDELILRQLIRRRYKYLGMLGSAEKVRVLFDVMRRDGFTEEEIARVHAPIGLLIHSKTPEEIAVSIAAEVIRVKNME
jgi:xanthine dehydrogenase accessory factor